MSKSPDNVAELIKIMREEQKLNREEAIARETRLFLTSATVKPYTGSKVSTKIQYFLDEIIRISNGFSLTDEQMIILAGRKMSDIAEKTPEKYRKVSQLIRAEFNDVITNKSPQKLAVQEKIHLFYHSIPYGHMTWICIRISR